MVRSIVLIAIGAFLSGQAQSQSAGPFVQRGLLSADASLGPGVMLGHSLSNSYVTGGLELFLEDRVSFRGYAAWFIDREDEAAILSQNSRLSWGPYFHLVRQNVDLALGFEPGLSLTRLAIRSDTLDTPDPKVLPNMSISGSATLYVSRHFHFFANVRYVYARYPGTPTGPIGLDELVFTGGLGWQMQIFRSDRTTGR